MATFKYYNFQVLPLDGETKNLIGSEGYEKIFTAYSLVVNKAFRDRKLISVAHSLKNEMHISFKRIDIKNGYAQGKIIKFNHVDKLTEVYTNQELYENTDKQSIASSKRFEFDFVFDFKKHIFAIEAPPSLPSERVLIDALTSLFAEVVGKYYEKHYIKVVELSDAADLETIFETAEGYKKVSVEITFSNSDKFEARLINLIDEHSRENNIQTITAEQKPPKNSKSKALSVVVLPLVILSTKLGNSDITYVRDGKDITYHMRDYPVKQRVGRDAKMTDDDYYSQIQTSITNAEFSARTAEATNKRLMESNLIDETNNESERED